MMRSSWYIQCSMASVTLLCYAMLWYAECCNIVSLPPILGEYLGWHYTRSRPLLQWAAATDAALLP